MGLYGNTGSPQDMYWYGSSEGAYDPGCDPSPTMPQLHDHAHAHDHAGAHEQAPLTPSSSSSSSNSSASSGGPGSFVSPCSERANNYVSPGSDAGSTGVGSPATVLSSGGVSSVPSGGEGSEVSFCAGCSGRIIDRFYLRAVERKWHAGCLRCVACHAPLDDAVTCFARDGHIFCRDDYHRLFSVRRCARCTQTIGSSELVMRAREFVYHVQCFTCAHCNVQLTKGDQFGMSGPLIYCRDHYQMSALLEGGYVTPMGMPPGALPGAPLPPGPHQLPHHGLHPHLPPEVLQGFPPPEHGGKLQYYNGVGTHHKGRPRKRKPKDEPMDTNMNIPGGYDLEGSYGPLGTPCQSVRTKRIRTSFKHNQLRIMKSYFALNHNPDAKDLKQLSQKTGLSKRVLQVWFQNARAKWRRQMVSKDPKALSGGGGEGGLSEGQQGEGSAGDYPDTPTVPPSAMSPEEGNSSQISYQQMF
ncbi:LIM/homeobox protein Lhx9 isoform X2 [Cherax quadricarinatus]|uniref:LIM/homeobox protein Lhx9 isoform X2 n=1 Tax=Cherax quadricarinatus TaxID=27406 RepID=UPI002378052D|nr:LIM/homeobox protein Lhx9-like isoform X2 [Cherax quadricarinatus]